MAARSTALVGALIAFATLAACPDSDSDSSGSTLGRRPRVVTRSGHGGVTKAGAEEVARAYLVNLTGGKFAGAVKMSTAKMRAALPAAKLAATWNGLVLRAGRFVRVLSAKVRPAKYDAHTVVLRAKLEKAPFDVTVSVNAAGRVQGLWFKPAQGGFVRPQHPKPPYPYVVREVSFVNKADKTKLAGTLTLPKGTGPFAAALLISGSGPQDRDETIQGHKPFLVLADHLTRAGFAVLRVDDRGVGKSGGDAKRSTIEIHATDVTAAVAFLAKHEQIDRRRIGLVGHSEGGVVAPMVASSRRSIAFIISLAGSGVPGTKLLPAQVVAMARALPGMTKEKLAKVAELQQRVTKAAASGDAASLAKAMRVALTEGNKLGLTGGKPLSKAQLELAIKLETARMTSPWQRSFLRLDPARYWPKVRCPVLLLNGKKDVQVDAELNLPPIRAALARARNKDVTVKVLPNLNHLFQRCKTGQVDEYAKITETFDRETLALITAWLVKRFGGAAKGKAPNKNAPSKKAPAKKAPSKAALRH